MSGVGVKTSGGWWGAKGCGLVVGLGVVMALALATGWVVTLRPLHEAVEAREALAELYGTQDEFTPPAHGAVPAERMEAFLAVREQLAGSCARLTESRSTIDSVEDFEWVDQPKKREELFESPWSRGLAAIGLELRRGEFWRARNEALLDAGMGLGEYSYLFVLAYSSHLVPDQEGTGGIANGHVNVLTRVRRLLLETLRRQLAAVEPPAFIVCEMKVESIQFIE